MSADVESKPIPKGFLCRRCNHCGTHLRPDGLVDCEVAKEPVPLVSREDYDRFEHCPQRSGFTPIPGYKLRLLANYARRVRDRDGSEVMQLRIESAESVIRSDIRIAARIKR